MSLCLCGRFSSAPSDPPARLLDREPLPGDRHRSIAVAGLPCTVRLRTSTVPLPLPVPPAVIVIQEALLTAVQLQPAGAVTATLALPPALGNAPLV